MSPLSWPVVVGTLILGSPALWAAQVSRTLSPDVALVRLGVCLVAVWATCTLVTVLTARTVAANELATADDESAALNDAA